MEARDRHEEKRDVMTEAIFTGEEIKEFSFVPTTAVLTAIEAVSMDFTKDLFVRDRPGKAGDGNGQQKQFDELQSQRWHETEIASTNCSVDTQSAAEQKLDGRRRFSGRLVSDYWFGVLHVSCFVVL